MQFTTRPEICGTFGVAASTHWLASSLAMSILERGGNAFDAAVAAGFTLAPLTAGLLVRHERSGAVETLQCPAHVRDVLVPELRDLSVFHHEAGS